MATTEDTPATADFILEPADNARLANLCGQFDEHLRHLEQRLGIEINNRGAQFRIIGPPDMVQAAERVLKELYAATAKERISRETVHMSLSQSALADRRPASTEADGDEPALDTKQGRIRGRGANQRRYLHNIAGHDLNFGIGPAGTGKTYLAVASAVAALNRDEVRRLVLVRPAVEAGERLGFLPGDLTQKVDPYLRPIYDALYEMLGFERVTRLMERSVIEVAPLAFMRGRTLNEAFIILDEAQNTTIEQMKMFLTRIGFGSRTVVTGDITQVDLPRVQRSGLRDVVELLRDMPGVSFTFFTAADVVRHPLVQRIVTAYEQRDKE
ncbi:MAG TPA: PhoH family protein [Gammaproteobacteria bacterium]|jgi:phosphate starvation-inducible PhoH-like protein|nr:PhoH family protein [Gammaproteobacteria bacterium]